MFENLALLFENLVSPTAPPIEVLVPCAVAAVAVSIILAACFSPLFAVCSERMAVVRKRGFYAKTAQQAAQMNLFLSIVAAGSVAACFAYAAAEEPELLEFPYRLPLVVSAASSGLFIVFLAAYVAFRPKKGNSGPLHICVGLAAGCLAIFSLFLGTGMARRLMHTLPQTDPSLLWDAQLINFFSIPLDSFFWPLLAESVPLGFAFAAAFASVWLLLVRNQQDFGRDYYAFSLRYCAKWALTATLAAVPLGAYAFFEGQEIMLPELSHLPSLLLDALSLILPLSACLLWIIIIRSEHPMRNKISIVLAALFLLTGFAAQILMFNKIIPSP